MRLTPRERTLLESQPVARLATIARDGRPHLVPVCFAILDGPGGTVLAMPVDEKPKRPGRLARLANLERDPRATLLVDRYDADWSRLAWVRLDVDAVVLEQGDGWPEALTALRARYPQYRTMDLEALPLVRFVPARIVSWFASG
ncbi:MAG: TIGR03668 family PPOX class F420-dependent oxidoreductase [Dehalococcoidia bacterium]|nr:TIGR03668 family PPOX class F420-dependent oxidoreductase [Dehalococcoidia bacterium]